MNDPNDRLEAVIVDQAAFPGRDSGSQTVGLCKTNGGLRGHAISASLAVAASGGNALRLQMIERIGYDSRCAVRARGWNATDNDALQGLFVKTIALLAAVGCQTPAQTPTAQ